MKVLRQRARQFASTVRESIQLLTKLGLDHRSLVRHSSRTASTRPAAKCGSIGTQNRRLVVRLSSNDRERRARPTANASELPHAQPLGAQLSDRPLACHGSSCQYTIVHPSAGSALIDHVEAEAGGKREPRAQPRRARRDTGGRLRPGARGAGVVSRRRSCAPDRSARGTHRR